MENEGSRLLANFTHIKKPFIFAAFARFDELNPVAKRS
jgi:hypothetical protein